MSVLRDGPGELRTRRRRRAGGCPLDGRGGAQAANIPEFVRPMARTGIEKFAQRERRTEVDERVLDEARDHFGM